MATTNTSKNASSNRLIQQSVSSGMGSIPLTNLGTGGNYGYDTPSSSNQMVSQETMSKVGNFVDKVGTKLKLPELKVSEVLASGPTVNTTAQTAQKIQEAQQKAEQERIKQSSSGGGNVSSSPNDLEVALIQKGYNPTDAKIAANGPNADKLRSEYLGGGNGSGDQGPSVPSDNEILGKYKDKTGLDMDPNTLEKIKSALGSGANLDSLINQIEEGERGAAEEDYRATMGLLASQKDELGKTAEYQKGKLGKQLESDVVDINDNRTRDVASIDKQRADFDTSYEKNKDTIGTNWRALSLRTQALSRARGITNSDFAATNESKQAMDLNKGLRELATNAQSVLGDFMTALKDTNDYYAKAESKLRDDAQTRADDVDEWLRSSVVSIQAEEGKALGQKLADIKTAASNAARLKLGIAQQAETRRQNLEDWLLQTKTNFDNSLKLAAAGKVQSASDTLQNIIKQQTIIKNGLATGTLAYDASTNGTDQVGVIHGSIPGMGEVNYTTPYSAYEDYRNNLKKLSPLEQLQQSIYGSLNPNQSDEQSY